ncbi:hypothetical protein VPH35_026288 [Triticum aestivum]
MAASCVITLMKASWCNFCQPSRAASGERLRFGHPDRTMAVLWCRYSLGRIVCGAAQEDRGMRWSGKVLHGASAEMSSHAWLTSATLCHAWSAGATHDRSFTVFAS